MNHPKRWSALWAERIFGPRPGLKEINLISWGLFIGVILLPIFATLLVQFKTGKVFFRQSSVDFINLYGTGRIANEHPAVQVYNYDVQLQVFNQILPLHDATYGPSPYPPFVSQFFRLFARMPFEQAYFLWMGISLALYIAGLAVTLRAYFPAERLKSSLVFCFALASYTFLMDTLANGQLSSVAVCSVGLSVSQEKRSRPFLSGLVLSILTYKPTLLLLLVPMLLLTRRFRALFGFVVGAGTLAVVSTLFAGVQIWPAYELFLLSFGRISGINGRSSLPLSKYVDFNSLSYAVPGGRSKVALIALLCIVAAIAIWLGMLLWKSANGRKPEQYLAWAATLTWTMLLNVYYPIYDSILVTIAVVLTLAAFRDLEWKNAAGWNVLIAILMFGASWITESIAKKYGVQLMTILLIVMGIAQASALQRAIRQRSSQEKSELLAT